MRDGGDTAPLPTPAETHPQISNRNFQLLETALTPSLSTPTPFLIATLVTNFSAHFSPRAAQPHPSRLAFQK